jgi:peptidyl-prolyl cis-trans isomerase D
MLEFIRTHQRLMQFILLLIIFPSFAFLGIESYLRMSDKEPPVAKVAGQTISQGEWDAAQARQAERFKQIFGEQFNASMFDSPEAKQGVLENLLAQKAMSAYVVDNNLSVSNDTLRNTILEIPGLKNPDGQFDKQRYQQLLAAQGLTPEKFEAGLKHDLAVQQVNAVVQGTAFSPKTVVARVSTLNQQAREVQELVLPLQSFRSQVKVTDAMAEEYYKQHPAQFAIPETIKAEFVVFNPDIVEDKIEISEADIKAYYEQNLARYKTDEQRRASHILIAANKDAPAADKAAAKAKAEKLLAQLRKNPNDFAKLAKENSQDTGSAERGGDLDFFGKGMMVKPFEDAAYALKEGDISDVVQSDFGFHIIRLTAVKAAATRALSEVKANITDEIRRQKVGKKYSEMAEVFTNMVYEQPDSLKPVADKLGLKIETISGLTRKPSTAYPKTAAFNQAKFLQALFSDEATKSKRNTEAIEVSPQFLIAGRVVEYKPVTQTPLPLVRQQVEESILLYETEKLALKAGEAKLAELRSGGTAEFSTTKSVSRNSNSTSSSTTPPPAVTAIMKADVSKLPAYVGVNLGGMGYRIFRINKITEETADAASGKAEEQQVNEFLAAQEMAAYLGVIKKRAKAEILKPTTMAKAAPATVPLKQ